MTNPEPPENYDLPTRSDLPGKEIKFPVKKESDIPEGLTIDMTPAQSTAIITAMGLLNAHFPIVLFSVCLGHNPHAKRSVIVMASGTPKQVKAIGTKAVEMAPSVLKWQTEQRAAQQGRN